MDYSAAWPTLFLAWSVLIGFLVLPGPNMIAVGAASLGDGRQQGVATALGVATGTIFWALLTAFGLVVFLESVPIALNALKIVGGTYLIWLGIRSLRAALNNAPATFAPGQSTSMGQAYLKGLGVIALNPKAFLGWTAISAIVIKAETTPGIILVFVAVSGLLSFLNYAGFAVIFSSRPAVRAYTRLSRLFEAFFGLLFCAFGVRILSTFRG